MIDDDCKLLRVNSINELDFSFYYYTHCEMYDCINILRDQLF